VRVILEIVSGPSAGKQFEVRDGQVIRVGFRRPSEVPDDPWQFDVHFALECKVEQCRLRNLNSRSGMALNGETVTEATVRDMDKIVAGGTRFVVRMSDGVAAPAAAAPVQLPEQPAASPGAA
jgi:Inner membrane component of T3SS, cytoplasmic domain